MHAGIPTGPEADPPGAGTPMLGDTGNKRAVYILVECILVLRILAHSEVLQTYVNSIVYRMMSVELHWSDRFVFQLILSSEYKMRGVQTIILNALLRNANAKYKFNQM